MFRDGSAVNRREVGNVQVKSYLRFTDLNGEKYLED